MGKNDDGSRLEILGIENLIGALVNRGPMTIEAKESLKKKREEISTQQTLAWATATEEDLRRLKKGQLGTNFSLAEFRAIRQHHRIRLARSWGLTVLEP